MLYMDVKELTLKLRAKRVLLGRTQDEVAQAVGLDRASYTRLEHGEYDVKLSKFLKVLEFLEVEWNELGSDSFGVSLKDKRDRLSVEQMRIELDRLTMIIAGQSKKR